MTAFEFVSIFFSVIVGLTISHILSAASDLIEIFKRVRTYWVNTIWVVTVSLLFLFGCRSQHDTLELVWEQKGDSTKTTLNKRINKEWLENKGEKFMEKAKQLYKDKFQKEKEKKE